MRLNDILQKAVGLVYESDNPVPATPSVAAPVEPVTPRPVPKTTEQIVRESPGPNLDQIKAEPTPNQPVVDPDGKIHYDVIYQLAQIPATAFTAEQVLELLASFPADLPMQAKRAAVKVTIDTMAKTMGVNSEMVIADASRKLKALATFTDGYGKQVDQFVEKANSDIESLKAEIARREAMIADAKTKADQVVNGCTTESNRLDDVLEFFSLDVAPSKYAKS